MQMIDVLKRLAELDAQNPNVEKTVVKESAVAECGMMPMPGMGAMSLPSHPPVAANFSINATAATGDEVANMLTQIMTLAGVHKVGDEHMGSEPPPAVMTMEPTAGDTMRSVIDKLNPDADDVGGEEGEEELGPFQGDDNMSAAQGDVDNDGDHDMDDHDAEDDREEVDEYDNTPADATNANEFDPEQFAHQENPPGADRKGNANNPRAYDTNESIANRLMSEYKQFIGESEEADEDVEEGMLDKAKAFGKKVLDKVGHGDDEEMIKDLQKKAGVPQTGKKPEPTKESADDILKLAGLK